MSLYATGNQTVGPYLHIGLDWLVTRDIAAANISGERVAIQGRLLDGDLSIPAGRVRRDLALVVAAVEGTATPFVRRTRGPAPGPRGRAS